MGESKVAVNSPLVKMSYSDKTHGHPMSAFYNQETSATSKSIKDSSSVAGF